MTEIGEMRAKCETKILIVVYQHNAAKPQFTSSESDVESDSTVRADLTRQKSDMSEFMGGGHLGADIILEGNLVIILILQPQLPAEFKGKLPTARQLSDAVRRALPTPKEAN